MHDVKVHEAMERRTRSRFDDVLVIIKGGGDLASGVAYRLKRSGFPLIMTELSQPSLVRRAVCYGDAVYSGTANIEGIAARRVETRDDASAMAFGEQIPVLVDPNMTVVDAIRPRVIVDAIMAKINTGLTIHDAPLTVALGPGFTAGDDCHAVIETNRGHRLGRVIYRGQAEADTRTPGIVNGRADERVLRAPVAGHVLPAVQIGDLVAKGQLIATVDGHAVHAPFAGVIRGLIHPAVEVTPDLKIGDLGPRSAVEDCFTISDKSLAIGGGVLEAILALT